MRNPSAFDVFSGMVRGFGRTTSGSVAKKLTDREESRDGGRVEKIDIMFSDNPMMSSDLGRKAPPSKVSKNTNVEIEMSAARAPRQSHAASLGDSSQRGRRERDANGSGSPKTSEGRDEPAKSSGLIQKAKEESDKSRARWVKLFDAESGLPYYFNEVTSESSWTAPEELK